MWFLNSVLMPLCFVSKTFHSSTHQGSHPLFTLESFAVWHFTLKSLVLWEIIFIISVWRDMAALVFSGQYSSLCSSHLRLPLLSQADLQDRSTQSEFTSLRESAVIPQCWLMPQLTHPCANSTMAYTPTCKSLLTAHWLLPNDSDLISFSRLTPPAVLP